MLLFLIVSGVFLIEMATDIYLPSLPEITSFFKASFSEVQMTITAYLTGLAVSGFLSGPLSDSYGRRRPILWGMGLFFLGSILCVHESSLKFLTTARFLQGLGAGVGITVFTAIIRDVYIKNQCSKIMSIKGMLVATSPMLAPILGAHVSNQWHWQANFLLLAILSGSVYLFNQIFLKETLLSKDRTPLDFVATVADCRDLIFRSRTIGYAFISALTYGALWIWIIESPYYMISVLGLDPITFSYYSIFGPLSYMVGTAFNAQFIERHGVSKMLKWGVQGAVFGAFALLIVSLVAPHNTFVIYAVLCIFGWSSAPIFANAAVLALEVSTSRRGKAAAILGTLETLFGVCGALAISAISNGTLFRLALLILISTLVCWSIHFNLSQRQLSLDQPA